MKIGIYAGSFNPIHNVHLSIANKLIDENIVEKVIFVPAGDNYEKSDLALGSHRIEMIKRAIANNSKLSYSDVEISNGKLYSYQTLDYFKDEYDGCDLYFIMGSDNLEEFHKWKNYEYILQTYNLIVFLRNDQNMDDFLKYKEFSNIIFIDYNVRLSSTEIRNNIKNKEYELVLKKIPNEVYSYIKEIGLYE